MDAVVDLFLASDLIRRFFFSMSRPADGELFHSPYYNKFEFSYNNYAGGRLASDGKVTYKSS